MNTKVYIDILKENWGFLAGAILFLLLGILVMVLPDRSVYPRQVRELHGQDILPLRVL